jgi:hypothetical protein
MTASDELYNQEILKQNKKIGPKRQKLEFEHSQQLVIT